MWKVTIVLLLLVPTLVEAQTASTVNAGKFQAPYRAGKAGEARLELGISFSMLPRAIAPRGIATPFDSLTSRTTRAVTGWRRWHDFVLSGVSRRSHRTVPGGRVALD